MPYGRATVGLAVFVVAFAVYVLTAPQGLRAYEPETAALTEGFVRTGEFQIIEDSPMATSPGVRGKDGKLVGRVGLPQPVAEAPFYLAGWTLDTVANSDYRYRKKAMLLFNGFVMALVAALVFLISEQLQGSRRWSIAIAFLFAFASLAWPYSKIGAESMVTLGFALALWAALIARGSPKLWPWALAGFGAGMAVAAKQYALVPIAAMTLVVWPAWRADASRRIARLAAVAVPFAAWMVAMLYYNWERTGSIFKTANSEYSATWAAPVNLIGFLVSPGKGLLWYSPLVVLGVLGVVVLWREDRKLAVALTAVFVAGLCVVAIVPHWSDETWGPRYLMPVAWLPLLAIPFWATTRRRVQVVGAVAAVAVVVQLVAIVAPFTQVVKSTEGLTGIPLFEQREPGQEKTAPFGRDSIRWIPQLSPLLTQSALVVSRAATVVGLPPITLRYAPYEGAAHRLTLSEDFAEEVGFIRPDFWWLQRDAGKAGVLAALLAVLAALTAGRVIRREWRASRTVAVG
jgi:hypothetical protein